MKQEDIKKSLDQIDLDDKDRQKIIDNVLKYKIKKSNFKINKNSYFRFAIPAFACVFVIVGSIAVYNFSNVGNMEGSFTSTIGDATFDDKSANNLQGIDNMMAVVDNQFVMDNTHYSLLPDALKADFAFPNTISDSDVGKKITTISTTVDPNLMGCDVYEFLPAGSLAVVAVKINNVYKLFEFFNYESYNNNKDEDTAAYLKLYGIHSAEDIAKIQFIGHSEEVKLAGKQEPISELNDHTKIAEFYDYYSVIKDSSSKYFDSIMNFKTLDTNNSAPESAPDIFYDKGDMVVDSGSASSSGSASPSGSASSSGSAGTSGSTSPSGSKSTIGSINPNGTTSTSEIINPSGTTIINGTTGTSSSASSSGSMGAAGNVFSDSVTIRIYNKYGVYYEAEYYPKFGFISRHEVTDEFANFLKDYIY